MNPSVAHWMPGMLEEWLELAWGNDFEVYDGIEEDIEKMFEFLELEDLI